MRQRCSHSVILWMLQYLTLELRDKLLLSIAVGQHNPSSFFIRIVHQQVHKVVMALSVRTAKRVIEMKA